VKLARQGDARALEGTTPGMGTAAALVVFSHVSDVLSGAFLIGLGGFRGTIGTT
jgi:hypothetical protein